MRMLQGWRLVRLDANFRGRSPWLIITQSNPEHNTLKIMLGFDELSQILFSLLELPIN